MICDTYTEEQKRGLNHVHVTVASMSVFTSQELFIPDYITGNRIEIYECNGFDELITH